uniref:Reverse transcriptase N-terminal domain-containing protein n=1 Tax=Periphykon beckeri TaxID=2006982 RepID=A0A1Z1M3P6_9FLOR|nr:hypothetical protein [Periphykon beckeri]ARW60384.1 hypothetical protein [Periphykon beckeri]
MITKQIYLASQKYNLAYVYKLQKYLINSIEVKLILINQAIHDIQIYYSRCVDIKFLIKNINKLHILKSLLIQGYVSCNFSQIIIQQIKQSLICLSIKPTWKAKLSKNFIQYVSSTQSNQLLNTYYKKKNTYFLTKMITKKICYCNYICKSVIEWLCHNILFSLQNIRYDNYSVGNSNSFKVQISKPFFFVLSNVMLNDLHWHIFINIRKRNKDHYTNTDIKTTELYSKAMKDRLLKMFNLSLTHLLYRKSKKGFNKINIFNKSYKLIKKIESIYIYNYSSSYNFISTNFSENCNNNINSFIYIIKKKQANKIFDKLQFFYYINNVNHFLNKFSCFCNVRNFYLNF